MSCYFNVSKLSNFRRNLRDKTRSLVIFCRESRFCVLEYIKGLLKFNLRCFKTHLKKPTQLEVKDEREAGRQVLSKVQDYNT